MNKQMIVQLPSGKFVNLGHFVEAFKRPVYEEERAYRRKEGQDTLEWDLIVIFAAGMSSCFLERHYKGADAKWLHEKLDRLAPRTVGHDRRHNGEEGSSDE